MTLIAVLGRIEAILLGFAAAAYGGLLVVILFIHMITRGKGRSGGMILWMLGTAGLCLASAIIAVALLASPTAWLMGAGVPLIFVAGRAYWRERRRRAPSRLPDPPVSLSRGA